MTNPFPNEFSGQGRDPQSNSYADLKARMQSKVQARLPASMLGSRSAEARQALESACDAALTQESLVLSWAERARLLDQLADELLGLGPLEPLLKDEHISEILVDGPERVYFEKNGQFQDSPHTFRDAAHLMEIIRRIIEPQGQSVDESHPFCDVRLSDGSRINVAVPPIAVNGPTLVIRKFWPPLFTQDDLLKRDMLNQPILDFLRACVLGRLNIVVSGGTGSGKTTLFKVLAETISPDERILLCQHASEFQLPHKRLVILETRPPNLQGRGEITMQDLVRNAVKMRPDRILLAEALGPEVLDMLQATNMGHNGSMLTVHANSPRDALARLEVMAALANPSIPVLALREQLASALQLVVHAERLRDGMRKIVALSEVDGLQGGALNLKDILVYEVMGFEAGKLVGQFRATGYIPKFLQALKNANIDVPPGMFTSS